MISTVTQTDSFSYADLADQLAALTQGVAHRIAGLSNASALLAQALADINWAGFYLMQGDRLILGPFQGKPACVEIAPGRGVCGTAAELDQPQVVADVHRFPGHIACDSASRSEIVLPLHRDGHVAAVLDIDSPTAGRFTQQDCRGLSLLVPILEKILEQPV